MTTLIDEKARIEATDPTLSCLLQAPAGSGKTEVLTQRLLRLLSRVDEPEHIIALTFTRKAASEMRERVLSALKRAQTGEPANTPHQQKTRQYALEALAQDAKRQWQLLSLPHRLKITTIDSLCQKLTSAMPLFERNIPYAKVTDKAALFYRKAAKACFQHALNDASYQPALVALLKHFDNRQDKVIQILSEQLQTREQWLRKLFTAQQQDKQDFENALERIETHEIERFKASIPASLIAKLIPLARQVAHIENNPESPRFILNTLSGWDDLNPIMVQALSTLLLTSQLTWRKGFDHHVGLKRGQCESKTYEALKEESKALLAELAEHPKCLEALLRVRQLPTPFYPEPSWDTLQALFTLLPLLTAHLELVWQTHNCTDFTAVSTAAHQALSTEGTPTDLALYLDNTIHHLLIDEFQDTSMQQFELLSQLVEGFGDGKTIFVVGDPMQSIYRFRGAEVGLFLRAKYRGIGPVKLKFLQLECNFRANATLVQWINTHFKTIFPPDDDLELGAIRFYEAKAVHEAVNNCFVHARQSLNKVQETQQLLDILKYELATYPKTSIAILVRSRHQLGPIIQQLREANIAYQGVDIDWLSALPHIQDAWSLTQCLLTPGSNLAWASFLRSPWCGLSLSDLLALAQNEGSIFEKLSFEKTYEMLSKEGQARAKFCYQTVLHAIENRQQQPLSQWILRTLQSLHLESLLTTREQLDLHEYLNLVEQYEKEGILDDLAAFEDALNMLYSKQMEAARIQIMTIHKAKGLEFDCVILPGLSARTTQTHQPLLRWLSLPSKDQDLVLVSPLKATHEESSPLYDYLSKLDKEKELYEQQRLLYVAATRARSRLYLSDFQESTTANTFKKLLQQIPFETTETTTEINPEHTTLAPPPTLPELRRLPYSFYTEKPKLTQVRKQQVSLHIDTREARFLGIATHVLLQWICTYHPQNLTTVPWMLAQQVLRQHGIVDINAMMEEIRTYLTPLFETPRGRWLIQAHLHEQNEYPILVKTQGTVHTRIIDRTFEENGIRWIIDFKTGNPSIEHHEQISAYAKHLSCLYSNPIRCGLYYLASGTWEEIPVLLEPEIY